MSDQMKVDALSAEVQKLQELERQLRQDGWKGPQDCSSAYYLRERLSELHGLRAELKRAAPPASTPEER
jgi:hypothetical protein